MQLNGVIRMDLFIAKDKVCAYNGSREWNSEKNKGFYFRCTVRSCRKEISVL